MRTEIFHHQKFLSKENTAIEVSKCAQLFRRIPKSRGCKISFSNQFLSELWYSNLVKRQNQGNEFKGSNKEIFEKLAEELSQGKIIALKNTAGYLLMCDATNSEAVSELRKKKADLQNLSPFYFLEFQQ